MEFSKSGINPGINRVLFVSEQPLQDEQGLFEWALALAANAGAALKVVRVLPAISPGLSAWLRHTTPLSLQQEQQAVQLQDLAAWRKQAEETQVEASFEVLFGKLFFSVMEQVAQFKPDLVIKQIEPHANSKVVLLGSQDQHLLRKCSAPLLLHKFQTPSGLPYSQVAAAIDVEMDYDRLLDNERIEKNAQKEGIAPTLNAKILAWAQYLAPQQGIAVVHAWESEAENLVYHWNTDWSEVELQLFKEKERSLRTEVLHKEIRRYAQGDLQIQTFLPYGVPDEAVVGWLKSHQTELLVMGTVGRSGISGWLIGNTAEEILQQVNCSVLAIKPSGFKV
ncbi:universal stress protein [Thiomicrorhabdus cannonii]|uniref:universal stress protein n=1 Tax=Thiomicrorhabdus cannonii TaxID=2748011 RepID=UPI0015B8F496|nr:universal stress protein [Thiomicrorhabdus cannonii]